MKLECDVIRDLLPLYAEKLASPASSALVEQHLAACPACRAGWNGWKSRCRCSRNPSRMHR